MKEIPLSQGKTAIVDDGDYPFLSQFKWHARRNRIDGNWYATTRIGGIRMSMHRIVLNCPCELHTDHINCDTLDNRRENLRAATDSQNKANRGLQRNNTSGYKGVSKYHNKWHARIKVGGRCIHLGYFNEKEQAADAYKRAASNFFGEFARISLVLFLILFTSHSMASTIDKVVAMAGTYVGMREQPIGSNRGPEIDKFAVASGFKPEDAIPWCASFANWLYVQNGLIGHGAYSPSWYSLKRRVPLTDVETGDLGLVYFPSKRRYAHTIACVERTVRSAGRIIEVTDIEGNTSNGLVGSQREGDGCYRRVRPADTITWIRWIERQ